MNRRELIDYCLTLPGAYEAYPFGDDTTAMQHRCNKKSFAFIMHHDGKLYLNLKCDPFEADFLRTAYTHLIAGWHMNKRHWNTVIMGGDVPDDEIKRMIDHSYDLIKPKVRKPRR